jgi:very-short-patch-repair endonuclease
MPRTYAIITQRAKELRHEMTTAEKLLWSKLRAHRLDGLHIRRQHPIDRFIADFYCAPSKLVIEVDGDVHAELEQVTYDAEREAWLVANGYQVIRFTNEDVLRRLSGVLEAIYAACLAQKSLTRAESPSRAADGAPSPVGTGEGC